MYINALLRDKCELWVNLDGGSDGRGGRIPIPTKVDDYRCKIVYGTSTQDQYLTIRQDIWVYLPPTVGTFNAGVWNKVPNNWIVFEGKKIEGTTAPFYVRHNGRVEYLRIPAKVLV